MSATWKLISTIFIILNILLPENIVHAQSITLDSIFNTIEKKHPELKMYDAQINAYKTYAQGAKSLEPPQVGAGFFMTPYNTQMWKADGMNNGMGSFMLSGQQMFTNPRKLNTNSTYMKSMSDVEKEMRSAARNELFSMAKMYYYEWLILKKKLVVLNESERILQYIIQTTEIRYTYGMDKLNAYYKGKAMLGEIQQMKIMIEAEIKQKMVELNTIMANEKSYQFDIDTSFTTKDYISDLIDSTSIISNRSDYKALSQNINVLKSKQYYERSKLLPDFGIKYDHMIAFGRQPQQFSLMAMVTIPIAPWSSKMYRSSVYGLNYEIDAVKNQQSALLNNVTGTLQSIKTQMLNKKQQLDLYEKTIIPSMQKNYQSTLLAYEQNTEELFMVLDAWQNLKITQLGYLDILNDMLQLQVLYEKELEIISR